jgi:hypothetical protein
MLPAWVSSGGGFSNDLKKHEVPWVPGREGCRLEGIVEGDTDADRGLAKIVVNHALAVA